MFIRTLLAFVLLLIATPLRAEWHKAVSDSFIVYGDADEKQVRQFVRDVERFATVLRLRSGAQLDPDAPKLTIFLVSGQEAVRKAMGGGSSGVAGYYTANITGAYAVVPRKIGSGGKFDLDAQTVLFHEYAHHFMLQHFPGAYPAWYVEGFAEFNSTLEFRDDGAVELGRPALHRAYSLGREDLYPLKRMFATEPGKMTNDEIDRFYAWGWLLTHYLSFDKTRTGQLGKYLKAYQNGVPAEQAAVDAFGDIATLERDLLAYRKAAAKRILSMLVRGFAIPEPAIEIRPLDAAEAATMPLFIRFVQGMRSKEDITSFAIAARRAASRFPAHPHVLELLAEGELDAGELDAAGKANDALLAVRPQDARALLRRGRIAAARMEKNGFEGGWAAVRKLIVRGNRAAPNDPFPLFAYFDTYRSEGIKPPDIAFDGIRRAHELAPQERTLRVILASRLLSQGKRDDARVVLAPMLNDPHSAEVRERARGMLDGTTPPSKDAQGEDKDAARAH